MSQLLDVDSKSEEKSRKAFKYRIYPTRPQQRYINEYIDTCFDFYNFVYDAYQEDYRAAQRQLNKHLFYCFNTGYFHRNVGIKENYKRKPFIITMKYKRSILDKWSVKNEKQSDDKHCHKNCMECFPECMVDLDEKSKKVCNRRLKELYTHTMMPWICDIYIRPSRVYKTFDYTSIQNCFPTKSSWSMDECYPVVNGIIQHPLVNGKKVERNMYGSIRGGTTAKGDLSTRKLIFKFNPDEKFSPDVFTDVLNRLHKAFENMYSGKGGYPQRPDKNKFNSIKWVDCRKGKLKFLESDRLFKLTKFPGYLKINYHVDDKKNSPRLKEGVIKTATIKRDTLGRYYTSFSCDLPDTPTPKNTSGSIIGIDFGVGRQNENSRTCMTLSNGESILSPTWNENIEKKYTSLQRLQSKCKQNSKEWYKYQRKINHVWDDRNNKKDYWIHETVNNLIKEYDYIVIEDLNLKNMVEKNDNNEGKNNSQLKGERSLRKSFSEVALGDIRRVLEYKLLNGHLIPVNPAYTSKTCSNCGFVNKSLQLSDRSWTCQKCNSNHNRDINAAKNILNRGIKKLEELGYKCNEQCGRSYVYLENKSKLWIGISGNL